MMELTIAEKIKYVQDTLYVVSGKWKLPVLMALYEGVNRFRDLQRNIPGITTRVLSKELKALELNKLIIRKEHEDSSISVTYELEPYSFTLTPLVNEMINWGEQHRKEILRKT